MINLLNKLLLLLELNVQLQIKINLVKEPWSKVSYCIYNNKNLKDNNKRDNKLIKVKLMMNGFKNKENINNNIEMYRIKASSTKLECQMIEINIILIQFNLMFHLGHHKQIFHYVKDKYIQHPLIIKFANFIILTLCNQSLYTKLIIKMNRTYFD